MLVAMSEKGIYSLLMLLKTNVAIMKISVESCQGQASREIPVARVGAW